ncbi:MAG TPA: hypothetical protein VNZ57_09585, partial [Longimicrobiales bacterium]|nr:hypothetical protein [Longimicrobiales bacterium]
NLSLEIFAQPLVSNGVYGTPMEFTHPGAYDFMVYGREGGTLEETGNGYTIDPDGTGPATPFTLEDRSFTRRSLRGNAVLRWEYRPGSAIYVVWQQQRSSGERMDDFTAARAMSTLFDAPADNVLVLKWSYWLNP